MKLRVLSPSYPDVLALRQGQASRAVLRQGPARRHPHFIPMGMRLLQMGTEQ
jgi:hypothetical protein